ncbi:MAG: glycosyltransferase [Oscillospiraceae bacterium]|jgi:glycosyltransferase involved in cell wall biosynthesis|nr:glycosyltransferase [Oscillospiraceae bacterium]
MKKTKLLITSVCMQIGGIERSLIELLQAIDPARFDVALFLFSHTGPLMNEIPPHVRLLPENEKLATLLKPIKHILLRHPLLAGARLLAKVRLKCRFAGRKADEDQMTFANLQYYWDLLTPLFPPLDGDYDAVISFQWPHHYAAARVSAKRGIAFVHTDHRAGVYDMPKERAVWSRFGAIACVSADVKASFSQLHPPLAERCFVFENLLNPTAVKQKANAFMPTDMLCYNTARRLLTVGRYSHAKAFDNAVRICKYLRGAGLDIVWFAIGYGGLEEELRRMIAMEHLESHFILLGKKENPYPYMRACDLYVQPSRYEGRSVAVLEALTLGKPIVLTDFPTASAHIQNGETGLIVPMDTQKAAAAIGNLLKDPAQMQTLAQNAARSDVSGYAQLPALYAELEGQ